MKKFKIALTRNYLISINAKNVEQAKIFSEYYLGNCEDLSTNKERSVKKFSIEEIEMVWNEAMEIIL